MHILADENVPAVAVESLRRHGHDVCWIKTHLPGAKDLAVLELARQQERLLITFDKDFWTTRFSASASRTFWDNPLSPARISSILGPSNRDDNSFQR